MPVLQTARLGCKEIDLEPAALQRQGERPGCAQDGTAWSIRGAGGARQCGLRKRADRSRRRAIELEWPYMHGKESDSGKQMDSGTEKVQGGVCHLATWLRRTFSWLRRAGYELGWNVGNACASQPALAVE